MAERGFCGCGCGESTNVATKADTRRGVKVGDHYRFIARHNLRKAPVEYIEDPESGCWVWQRAKDRNGYGRASGVKGSRLAHRVVYERHRGLIPEGMQLDHLCRNPACVNPDHLEPVTSAENTRRGERTRLTRDDVAAIRASSEAYATLAERYGIHKVYVGQIRTGRKWVAA